MLLVSTKMLLVSIKILFVSTIILLASSFRGRYRMVDAGAQEVQELRRQALLSQH